MRKASRRRRPACPETLHLAGLGRLRNGSQEPRKPLLTPGHVRDLSSVPGLTTCPLSPGVTCARAGPPLTHLHAPWGMGYVWCPRALLSRLHIWGHLVLGELSPCWKSLSRLPTSLCSYLLLIGQPSSRNLLSQVLPNLIDSLDNGHGHPCQWRGNPRASQKCTWLTCQLRKTLAENPASDQFDSTVLTVDLQSWGPGSGHL